MTTLPTTGLMWSNLPLIMMSASGLMIWQPSLICDVMMVMMTELMIEIYVFTGFGLNQAVYLETSALMDTASLQKRTNQLSFLKSFFSSSSASSHTSG